MKDLLKWLHAHPIKACAFTCLVTICSTLMANDRVNFWSMLWIELAALFWWAGVFLNDTGKDLGKE